MGPAPHSAPLFLFLLRLGIRAGYERGRPAGGRELSRRKLLTAAVAVDRGERERELGTRFLGTTGGGEGDPAAEVVGFDWIFFFFI